MEDNKWNDDEGISIPLSSGNKFSFADNLGNWVFIFVGNDIYRAKVWEDSEMDGREYVIINHTIEYLDNMEEIPFQEHEWQDWLLDKMN